MANDKITIRIATKEDLAGVDAIENKIKEIENDPINVQLENQSAMMAVDQISSGFDRLKQGASELKTQMGEVLEASGRMENTETFLSMNIGAEQAKKKMEEIRNVTDQLPGDDVTLQNLLSQAAIKDANLGAEAMRNLGSAAADYMAGMQNFGKTSLETQQDLMNYILAGNTAEVERSPILQSHIDKLKEATTVQERSKALQEALNAEGWAGIASQDTYNNKLQKFNDMLTRGKMNLGDMFREPTEQAMEFTMQLDAITGGLVGMVFASAQMAQPITDSVMGLSQMAMGINAIKQLGFIQWFTQLGVATRLSTMASWAFGQAQAFVNAVIAGNPIALLVVALVALAAAFVWAYQNVDWFRNGVNNAFATVTQFAQALVSNISSAVNNFASIIQGIPQALQNCLNWAYNIVMNNPLVQALQWLGQQAVNAFSVLGLGQGSPGKIVGAMENELDWTKEAIEKHDLADTTANLGSDLSSNFNPQLPVNSNAGLAGGSTNNITINIESVDSEDKIQEIVDAVEEALKFDNLTAGRTA